MDLPYQVFNSQEQCVMHASESCRYPPMIELSLMEAGYSIRLHGKRITKADVRKEVNRRKC